MQVIRYPQRSTWKSIVERPLIEFSSIESQVRSILENVKQYGDHALKKYTLEFDKVEVDDFSVSAYEIEAASHNLPEILKKDIQLAKQNIEKFHVLQKELVKKIETVPGVTCWRKSLPIQRVGLYVPGGSAPLFSTVLMLAVPAKIAGCSEIILCTPPDKSGRVHPAVLYAASITGVTNIFKVGGAQAIAAMTFGTSTIPQVYKIFGPGNQYVTVAKQLATQYGVAIDMPAGPSEVAIFADATAHASFVAADLLSQAEHGIDSQVFLVTTEEILISAVLEQLEKQLSELPRAEIARQALSGSKIVLVHDTYEAIELLNEYAAEHLILASDYAEKLAEKIHTAGSVFLGHFTPESAGDYASGTNHTLPTNAFARSYSGVSLDSFVKKITFQQITPDGIRHLGPSVERMAEAEGLHAHQKAVRYRLEYLAKQFSA
ncbi:MAG: histidinol dehydrogenase [Cytophagales bacterium]|nr:histidinol dehydrogenase [Cytophagales bacterium]MDW8384291.1 histidinol dehydrogenase [Flammeovirgaceae bacterium]